MVLVLIQLVFITLVRSGDGTETGLGTPTRSTLDTDRDGSEYDTLFSSVETIANICRSGSSSSLTLPLPLDRVQQHASS